MAYYGLKNSQITEIADDEEPDVTLESPAAFFGSHVNLIPIQNAVQGPRLFYGARFMNQALPLVKPEAPLVQNLMDDGSGKSFDDHYGRSVGAVYADDDDDGADVLDVTGDSIVLGRKDGTKRTVNLYNAFAFNRKCLSGATRIFIRRDGCITRTTLSTYEFLKGDETLSYSPELCTSEWRPITGFVATPCDKRMYRISFQSGRSVDCTEDHSLWTMGDDWELKPLLPEECIEGTTACPVVFGNIAEIPDWSFEQGVIDGLYAAEGSMFNANGVSISVLPQNRMQQVRELVSRVCGKQPHNGKANCCWTDAKLRRRLEKDFGKYAGTKYIADHVFGRGRAYLHGLVAGYMAGDGNLWADANGAIQVTGMSTSEALRDGFVEVLNLLGVFATKFNAPRRHISDKWNDAYGFRVLSEQLSRLDRWFWYDDRHAKYLNLRKDTYRTSPFAHVPVPCRASRAMLYAALGNKPSQTLYSSASKGRVSKRQLQNCSGLVGNWGRGDMLWDTVVAVTPIPSVDRVYDISVASSEAFATADGLLVHNTAISNKTKLKKGDKVAKGQLLAHSNYTDENGTLAMGTNARVGLVPFKGWSMDDAIVISDSFARKLTSDHAYTEEMDYDRDTKGGKNHFVSLFPDTFTKKQLAVMDDQGVVKPGTVLKSGDPMILATKPRAFSSSASSLGKLSKVMRQARADAAVKWEEEQDGVVTDVAYTKNGVKVIVSSAAPTAKGDKIVFRSGQKGTVAMIIPDEHMPRTVDGNPLEVLLNPLGIPSRVNNSIVYELLMGKIAAKQGAPVKVPGFNKKGEKWYETVLDALDKNNLSDLEEVFDPTTNSKLENPVTVGNAYVLKLHHTSASKTSARSQGSYDCFDADTEVFTQRGWVKWPEVTSEDLLFNPYPDCVGGEFIKPDKLVSYDYNGELLAYTSKYLDWQVTPNHRFLVTTPKGVTKFETAEELMSAGKRSIPCAPLWEGGASPDTKIFPGVETPRAAYTEPLVLSFVDYVELTAWMLSEGSVQHDAGRYRITVWQNSAANPLNVERIQALFTRCGVPHYAVHRDGVIVGVCATDARLSAFYKACGSKACNKSIPPDILASTLAHRRVFLETYSLGDGSSHARLKHDGRTALNRISSICTTSEVMRDQLVTLLTSIGCASSITKLESQAAKFPGNRVYRRKVAWIIGIHLVRKTASVIRKDSDPRYDGVWSHVKYAGKVYCATMRNGLLLVRRNGKQYVTGNSNEQPAKGGGMGAQSKRFSGLEVHSMLSSGAYKTLREGSTLRGQRNDEYWRQLRAGLNPHAPGEPFAFGKFRALLEGSGMMARNIGGGKLRLGPMTDDELESRKPIEVKNGNMVDLGTLEPKDGGLFDSALVGSDKWGRITLPHHVPNPAFEAQVARLLGVTKAQLREVLAGRAELPQRD